MHLTRRTRTLAGLIRQTVGDRPRAGCEVGVWQGVNAEGLLRRFRRLYLTMVDPYKATDEEYQGRQVLTQTALDDAWQQALARTQFAHNRRHLLLMPSTVAAGRVLDDSQDFVFLDGLHDYDNVVADLLAWWPKVRGGGLFAGHDYGNQNNRLGIFGVDRAVNEFADERGLAVGVADAHIWWVVKQ